MREFRHLVPELGKELSVFVNEGDLDVYRQQYALGFPVPGTFRYLLGQPAPARVVDIGANIGGVAFFAAALGAKVLAVEALAENFVLLSEGVLANGLREVLPCHAAATDEPGVLHFGGYGAWGHVPKLPGATGLAPVPGLRGDDILDLYAFGDPDLVKIDVEGHELQVLKGLERTLDGPRPVVVIESNTWTYPDFSGYEAPLELLRRHGYALHMYVDHEIREDEDYSLQEFCVADYFCVPREKVGRVPMPTRRRYGVAERVGFLARDLVSPSAHWWHAAHMIDRFQKRFPEAPGLEELKARIAGEPEARALIERHPTPPPAWLATYR